MTSPLSRLTPEDRTALSKSADDLSDIDDRRLARIDAGFKRAYETARGIANDTLNPLTH
jgi:hypothetical protein